MKRTIFAGLTQLSAGDPLNIDGGSFKDRNIETIDQYLQRIVTHKHDGSPGLVNPMTAPTVTAAAVSGHVPPSTTVSVAYTMLDGLGGETAVSPIVTVTTPAGIGAASVAPSGVMAYSSGSLQIGQYQYAYTLIDAIGGETPASPPVTLERLSGHASGIAVISGMTAILAAHPTATGWRFYRSTNGAPYAFLIAGTSDGFNDNGLISVVAGTRPPVYDTTTQTGSVSVTVPNLPAAASAGFNLYLSTVAGVFYSPSLQGTYSLAQAGSAITLTTLAVNEGSPPPVSTAVQGSSPIALGVVFEEARSLAEVAGDVRVASAGSGYVVPIVETAGVSENKSLDRVWYSTREGSATVNLYKDGVILSGGSALVAKPIPQTAHIGDPLIGDHVYSTVVTLAAGHPDGLMIQGVWATRVNSS